MSAKHDFYVGVSTLIIMESFTQIVHRSLILIIIFLCKHAFDCISYDREVLD